jgi:hypothetical protein
VYWGSATKAYLIMWEQPWHHFILSFFISADHLYTHYCDCSGLIITLPIPIQSSPARVADAIATLSLADPSLLGLDPTMHMCHHFCQGAHTDLAVGMISWVIGNAEKSTRSWLFCGRARVYVVVEWFVTMFKIL